MQGAGPGWPRTVFIRECLDHSDEQRQVVGAMGTFTDLTAFIINNQKIEVLEEQTKSREAFDQPCWEKPPHGGHLSATAPGRTK